MKPHKGGARDEQRPGVAPAGAPPKRLHLSGMTEGANRGWARREHPACVGPSTRLVVLRMFGSDGLGARL